MDTPILIFGAQEKGQIALEIFQSNGLMVYGFLDHDKALQEAGKSWGAVSLLGGTQEGAYLDLLGEKCHPFIAMQDIRSCQEVIEQLTQKDKLHPVNALHAATNIAKEARLGAGNIVHVGSSIGSETVIHNYCTLMGHNMVGHGVVLHDFVYLGAGAIVNAGVTIHEETYIGSGAILHTGITIGAQARIAPGAVVMQDVPEGVVVAGNPASVLPSVHPQPKKS